MQQDPAEERGEEGYGRGGGSQPALDASFVLIRDGVEAPRSECALGAWCVIGNIFLANRLLFRHGGDYSMQMMGYSYAYRIVVARSGLFAVERVKRRRDTDLVVVEYRLPVMSGSDVMKEIKDVAPSILVLIVTAYGDEEVEVEAFRSDAQLPEEAQQKENPTRA
jgi:CheY-like chemotaxis protein